MSSSISLIGVSPFQAAEHLILNRYTTVATLALIIYEYLINFDHEIHFLWRRRFNIGFVLLFLSRYLPIVQIITSSIAHVWTSDLRPSHCSGLAKAITWMFYSQFSLASAVLYTRTYAVWAGNRCVLAFLAMTFLTGLAGAAYTIVQYDRDIIVLGLRYSQRGCVYLLTGHSLFYTLVQFVILDTRAISTRITSCL